METTDKYKVVKIYKNSGRRKTLYKDLPKEEAMRIVNSFHSSGRSMVVFFKQD